MTAPGLNAAGAQIVGARRRQEDAWALERFDDGGLLAVVADGLGGHPGGDIASGEAVAALRREFAVRRAQPDPLPREWLKHAVLSADAHLRDLAQRDPVLDGMATTLVALYLRDGQFWAASVGDSYLLLRRGERLIVLNELHSEAGGVTSCVGFHLSRVDLADRLLVEAGDRFLLATDGIATLDADEIGGLLGAAADPRTAVRDLLRAVEDSALPSQDNATVVAVFV